MNGDAIDPHAGGKHTGCVRVQLRLSGFFWEPAVLLFLPERRATSNRDESNQIIPGKIPERLFDPTVQVFRLRERGPAPRLAQVRSAALQVSD